MIYDCTCFGCSQMSEVQALHRQVRYNPCIERWASGFGLGVQSLNKHNNWVREMCYLCQEITQQMVKEVHVYSVAARVGVRQVGLYVEVVSEVTGLGWKGLEVYS